MDGPTEAIKNFAGELPEEIDTDDPDMVDRVLELFFLSEGKRSPADTESFGVVLERLAYAGGLENRAEIANRLAHAKDAPVRLMRRLAFDSITVARPVLQYSDCLSEDDLVTLATKLDQDHLNAIAHRLRLGLPVTDLLVERGNSKVRVSVTQNSSAAFSAQALERLSELAEEDEELRFALGLRPELSPNLFERFKSFVTEQLLVPADEDAPAPADRKQGTDTAKTQSARGAKAAEEEAKLAAKREEEVKAAYDPIRDSYASEKNLVKLAKGNMLNESIACMAKMTGVDTAMIEHCLLRAELSALMVLCKANSFGNTTFTALLQLRQSHNEEGSPLDITSMLYRYEAMQTHTAKRIIQYANKKQS